MQAGPGQPLPLPPARPLASSPGRRRPPSPAPQSLPDATTQQASLHKRCALFIPMPLATLPEHGTGSFCVTALKGNPLALPLKLLSCPNARLFRRSRGLNPTEEEKRGPMLLCPPPPPLGWPAGTGTQPRPGNYNTSLASNLPPHTPATDMIVPSGNSPKWS